MLMRFQYANMHSFIFINTFSPHIKAKSLGQRSRLPQRSFPQRSSSLRVSNILPAVWFVRTLLFDDSCQQQQQQQRAWNENTQIIF